MRTYQGAVLFVDMLGFSALTRGKLALSADQLNPWKVGRDKKFSHQHLAARIILAFRTQLAGTQKHFPRVKLAQLSDCAFIWSSDLKQVVEAGRHLMLEAARVGLLCRGGLAFGDIYEPDRVNHSLGQFIVGDAVTNAATYEGAGKGMRMFTDAQSAFRIRHDCPEEQFAKSFNGLNGDSVDEWRWYYPASYQTEGTNSQKFRAELLRLATNFNTLKYSPALAWSASSAEGRRQIACSLYALATAMEDMTRNTGYFLPSIEELEAPNQPRSTRAVRDGAKELYSELLDTINKAAELEFD